MAPERGSLRPPPASEGLGPLARFLVSPQPRRHLSKLVYAAEWAQSLRESHPPGPALDAALTQHWQEVGVIDRALGGALEAFAELAAEAGAEGSGSGGGSSGGGGGGCDSSRGGEAAGQESGRLQLGQRVLEQLQSLAAARGGVPVQWFV